MAFRPASAGEGADAWSLSDFRKHLILDLARPRRIRQGLNTFDCGPASAQGLIARQAPGQYARLVIDLATRGQAQTSAGQAIRMDRSTVGKEKILYRSVTGELLLPALRDMARENWPTPAAVATAPYVGGRVFKSVVRVGNGRTGTTRRVGGEEGAGEALTTHQYGQLMKSIMEGHMGNAPVATVSERRRLPGLVS
ncbi:MAG: hypothetical protein VKO21_11925 [Candidatus Sericytochromatia bacterium]|nr:hypothetical protein [Candidatus Sericytochromatia bacterium]